MTQKGIEVVCLVSGATSVPVWNLQTGCLEMSPRGGQQQHLVTVLDSGATSPNSMAWNYETGREEAMPYVGGVGPQSCPPPKFYKKGCLEILRWEDLEAAWYRDRNWTKTYTPETVIQSWENAEMGVIGWDKRAQVENFRRGYIDWLATQDGVADALSDLEIEQLPLIERIIARGYRELSKTEHPDVGGTTQRFAQLREAKKQLDQVMQEIGDLLKEDS